MPAVAVQKHRDGTKSIWCLFDETKKIFDEIQERAHSLFQERSGGDGSTLDDWFRAERELFNLPPSQLTEEDEKFHLRAAVPGLKSKDLKVTAAPTEILIQGEASKSAEGKRGQVRFSELSEKQVFRWIPLPCEIDVGKVKASLESGMLNIDMPKRAKPIKVRRRKT
jgi:HSP20 family molecular chaperone IbpA